MKQQLLSWTHEDMSISMLRYLLQANNIDISLPEYGALSEDDLTFIGEMIVGTPLNDRKGRPGPEKSFLYDIVNNKESGLDVDKMDYMQRDCERALGKKEVTFQRFTEKVRVATVTQFSWPTVRRKTLCYPEKLAGEAMTFFKQRHENHEVIYQHRKVLAMDAMILDILLAAHDSVKISVFDDLGELKELKTIAECALDPAAFSNLEDGVLDLVRNSQDNCSDIKKARALLRKLDRREHYAYCGAMTIYNGNDDHKKIWNQDLTVTARDIADDEVVPESDEEDGGNNGVEILEDGTERVHFSQIGWLEAQERKSQAKKSQSSQGGSGSSILSPCDLKVCRWHIHHGAKEKNPVDGMWFFYKDDDDAIAWSTGEVEAHRVDDVKYQSRLPKYFSSRQLKVLCKDASKVSQAQQAVREWCRTMKCHSPLHLSSQENSRADAGEEDPEPEPFSQYA